MQQFKQVNLKHKDQVMVKDKIIYTPDISKNFILNSAIRDATYILLRPYLASSFSSSYSQNIRISAKDEETTHSKQGYITKYQYFLTLMATIAWDFLNISNIFHCDEKQQQINSDS